MAFSTLVIRLTSDELEWAIHDETGCGEIHRLPAGQPLTALPRPPEVQLVHLLIPVALATFRRLEIPTAGYTLTPQKIQWLADETLDESSPPLHWTIVWQTEGVVWVAGVEPAVMQTLMLPLTAGGIRPDHVTLDALCLPITTDGWTVLKDEEGWLLKPHEGRASRLSEEWLDHLLTHYRPQQITSYGELPEAHTADTSCSPRPLLSLYSPTESVNLLHGRPRPSAPATAGIRRLKRLALIAVLMLLLCPLLSRAIVGFQLHRLEQQLTSTLEQRWRSYIPQNRHRGNLQAYLPKQLQQRFPAPSILLQRLGQGMAAFPALALEGIRYDQQRQSLQLFIYASDEDQIKQFITADAVGLPLKIEKHDQGLWTLRNE